MKKLSCEANFTYPLTINNFVVGEIEGKVYYTYTPGSPATGPTYYSGGEPPIDPEIEIDSIELYGWPKREVRNTDGELPHYFEYIPKNDFDISLHDFICQWLLEKDFDNLLENAQSFDHGYADWQEQKYGENS